MKDKIYKISMISGGRDSTCMTIKLLENGEDLDYIIFTDTLEEHDLMYEYILKVKKYIFDRFGKDITILFPKNNKTLDDWIFGKFTKGKNKGSVRGLPLISQPCYWKREAKVENTEQWLKKLGITEQNSISYIGYTASELGRVPENPKNQIYPLIDWNYCEGDIDIFLNSIDMTNPLYDNFFRTGCAICPYQSLASYYILYKKYPLTWDRMKEVEYKLSKMDDVHNLRWQRNFSILQLEERFKTESNWSTKPERSCECFGKPTYKQGELF